MRGGVAKPLSDALIIFWSKDITKEIGKIVGVYGKATIDKLKDNRYYNYEGFENDCFIANIQAEIDFSMPFPTPLNDEKYKKKYSNGDNKILVGQAGLRYKDRGNFKIFDFAKEVILDEINELQKDKTKENKLIKLKTIYEYYFGKLNIDELEENELIEIYKNKPREELINELLNNTNNDDDKIQINGKIYKRNNSNIAKIKLLRGFHCQICGKTIIKKDGSKYVEAAHIKARSKGGRELWNNIILLCPNHHKEFDIGKSEIVSHNENNIVLKIEDKEYSILFEKL